MLNDCTTTYVKDDGFLIRISFLPSEDILHELCIFRHFLQSFGKRNINLQLTKYIDESSIMPFIVFSCRRMRIWGISNRGTYYFLLSSCIFFFFSSLSFSSNFSFSILSFSTMAPSFFFGSTSFSTSFSYPILTSSFSTTSPTPFPTTLPLLVKIALQCSLGFA